METSAQFKDVLRTKVVRCGNAYAEIRAKVGFIDGLSTSNQSAIKIFWRRKQNGHLLETAQYAETLREQTRKVRGPVIARSQRNSFQRGRRTTPIVASVVQQRSGCQKHSSCYPNVKEKILSPQGSYGNCNKTKQATHFCMCLAKASRMELANILSSTVS